MEDAVRPDEQAFKAMYERGYCTWFSLYETTAAANKTHPPWWDSMFRLDHPTFPKELAVDASFSNTALAKGTSTWKTSQGSCDLPSFNQEFFIPIASDSPVILDISEQQQSASAFRPLLPEDDDHIALLVLAWTYILSARWAEIIPGASAPEYSNFEANWDLGNIHCGVMPTSSTKLIIDLGNVGDDAARWWAAVLALEGGWNASIPNDKGNILHSPWSTNLVSEQRFTLSRRSKSRPLPTQHPAASFSAALHYLSSYCELHNVAEQMHAALAATLLLPVARFDNRMIQLPTPKVRRKVPVEEDNICKTSSWSGNLNQLDKLLTLSCNAVGTKALLNSVFFEPSVGCNICGAWLQGTFAFLDSDIIQDRHSLLRVLMERDGDLGFLWLGAFIIRAEKRALQEARLGWWKLDLHVAAWTGTLMSFIQQPVSTRLPGSGEILRADECRLMYLSHDQSYKVAPLFPFAPFGSTLLTDTNIDVRQHAQCGANHSLEYGGLTWRCCGGGRIAALHLREASLRAKSGNPECNNIVVDYDSLDNEHDDCSEMVTRNIFTWLRDKDGFPVAERAIRDHAWIDNLDSDNDEPIEGDARSTAGGNLHGWLSKTGTWRSNSL
jgi:hypothetical protein